MSCEHTGDKKDTLVNAASAERPDTTIGRRTITNEIAGAAYRKRAIEYFVIANSDTSIFTCISFEASEGNRISIDMRFPRGVRREDDDVTYRRRMAELSKILEEVGKDFNLDSLRGIFLGRLVANGDLAVVVTKELFLKFGADYSIKNYQEVRQFLKDSKLATDLNNIFKKHALQVKRISVEKVFFTSKRDLFWSSAVATDTTEIPNRILDCMIWVEMEKI